MTQQMERLQSCYERALCRATDISGNQTFGFIVDSQGRVQNVMFENVMFETITIENTNLMNCTYRALHKLNPPQPPATATVSVELIYTVK